MTVDLWDNRTTRVAASRPATPEDCRCCGARRFEYLDGSEGGWEQALCGRDSVQVTPPVAVRIDLAALEEKLQPVGRVERNRFLLRVALPEHRVVVFSDGRAIVTGTRDPAVARSIYARTVGS